MPGFFPAYGFQMTPPRHVVKRRKQTNRLPLGACFIYYGESFPIKLVPLFYFPAVSGL